MWHNVIYNSVVCRRSSIYCVSLSPSLISWSFSNIYSSFSLFLSVIKFVFLCVCVFVLVFWLVLTSSLFFNPLPVPCPPVCPLCTPYSPFREECVSLLFIPFSSSLFPLPLFAAYSSPTHFSPSFLTLEFHLLRLYSELTVRI